MRDRRQLETAAPAAPVRQMSVPVLRLSAHCSLTATRSRERHRARHERARFGHRVRLRGDGGHAASLPSSHLTVLDIQSPQNLPKISPKFYLITESVALRA